MLRRAEIPHTQSSIDIMMFIFVELVCVNEMTYNTIKFPQIKLHFEKFKLFLHLKTGSNVLSYVQMVVGTLRHSIPKSVVYCQVREAKRSLLDRFFTELGAKEVCFILQTNKL